MSLQQIIDRRLSGKNKSIGNRERFLRRRHGAPRPAGTPADPPRGCGPAWGGPALGPQGGI